MIDLRGFRSLILFNMRILDMVENSKLLEDKAYYFLISISNFKELCEKEFRLIALDEDVDFFNRYLIKLLDKSIYFRKFFKNYIGNTVLDRDADLDILRCVESNRGKANNVAICYVNGKIEVFFLNENQIYGFDVWDLLCKLKKKRKIDEYLLCKIINCEFSGEIGCVWVFSSMNDSREFVQDLEDVLYIDRRYFLFYKDSYLSCDDFVKIEEIAKIRERFIKYDYQDCEMDIFAKLDKGDIFVHNPYDYGNKSILLLMQAIDDKDVISIRQTIYRLSSDSIVVRLLCEASCKGKRVEAFVECRARGNEAENRRYCKILHEHGVKVHNGDVGVLKVHAKFYVIERKVKGEIKYYTHFGTGNYNEDTEILYEDISVLSSNHDRGKQAIEFFKHCIDNKYKFNNGRIVCGLNLKNLIKKEIDWVSWGKYNNGVEGEIWIKCNSLYDSDIEDKLSNAVEQGVKVELFIRGMCVTSSESLNIKSVLGKYLQHSRVYMFRSGKEERWYIASADIRKRSFQDRIEFMERIVDIECIKELQSIKKNICKGGNIVWSYDGLEYNRIID